MKLPQIRTGASWYMRTARLLFAVLVLCCISCEDDPGLTEPRQTFDALFPLQAGNWWVYERFEIDAEGNRIAGTEAIDSVSVIGPTLHDGLQVNTLVWISDKGSEEHIDTVYARSDDRSLSVHSILLEPWMTKRVCCRWHTTWKVIATKDQPSWTVSDTTILASYPVTWEHEPRLIDLFKIISCEGRHKTEQRRDVNSIMYDAEGFWLSGDFRYRLDTTEIPEITFPEGGTEKVETSIDLTLWFARDIGLVQSIDAFLGIQRDLLRYHVQ